MAVKGEHSFDLMGTGTIYKHSSGGLLLNILPFGGVWSWWWVFGETSLNVLVFLRRVRTYFVDLSRSSQGFFYCWSNPIGLSICQTFLNMHQSSVGDRSCGTAFASAFTLLSQSWEMCIIWQSDVPHLSSLLNVESAGISYESNISSGSRICVIRIKFMDYMQKKFRMKYDWTVEQLNGMRNGRNPLYIVADS